MTRLASNLSLLVAVASSAGCTDNEGRISTVDAASAERDLTAGSNPLRVQLYAAAPTRTTGFLSSPLPPGLLTVTLQGHVRWTNPSLDRDPVLLRVSSAPISPLAPSPPVLEPPLPIDVVVEPASPISSFTLDLSTSCDDGCDLASTITIERLSAAPADDFTVQIDAEAAFDSDDAEDEMVPGVLPMRQVALLHPLSLGALVVLLVNDHWLKHAHPSWLTGKLSDFAGMVIFPLFLLSSVQLLRPRMSLESLERTLAVAIVLTGLTFTLAKTCPEVNHWVRHADATLRWAPRAAAAWLRGQGSPSIGGSKMVLDPTDLIALPALFVGVFVVRERPKTAVGRVFARAQPETE